MEEGAIMGGAGSAVTEALNVAGITLPVLQLGLPDVFIEHGDPAKLLALQGLDARWHQTGHRQAVLSQRQRADCPLRTLLRTSACAALHVANLVLLQGAARKFCITAL